MHRCRRLRGVLHSFGPAREDAGRRAADQRVEFRLLHRGHFVQGASTAAERSSLSEQSTALAERSRITGVNKKIKNPVS